MPRALEAPDLTPRRVQLTLGPSFAALRLPFSGREGDVIRGGGVNLDLDVQLWGPLWLRALGAYSAHPLRERNVLSSNMMTSTTVAPSGVLHVGNFGTSFVYALDLGRVLPMLDVGLGGLWLAAPTGVAKGQRGQTCQDNGACDAGLSCSEQRICEPAPILELHAGLTIDVLLGERWAVGAAVRYFARATAPGVYPVYLQLALRTAVRF